MSAMNTFPIHLGLFWILRLGLGFILIFASYDKILHPHQFALIVENYQVTGTELSRWIAVWLPYVEFITGVLLIFGIWLDAAILSTFVMMLLFFFVVMQAYLRGLDIHCGCFSVEGENNLTFSKLLENLLLVLSSMALMVVYHFKMKRKN